MKRVTYKSIIERQKKSGYSDLPKLKEKFIKEEITEPDNRELELEAMALELELELMEF